MFDKRIGVVDHSGDGALPAALNFFPVHKREKDQRSLTRTEFIDAVFGCNKIDNLATASPHRPEPFPWAVTDNVVREILGPFLTEDHISMIEVGTFIGTSAVKFAKALVAHSPDSYVVCVDTWLHDTSEYLLRRQNLGRVLGPANSPNAFGMFVQNVLANGVQTGVVPLRLTSIDAARVMFYHGVAVNVVFVDASHEFHDVETDLAAYWELLLAGGIMFGMNYQIQGVKQAVEGLSRRKGVPVETRAVRVREGVEQKLWFVIKCS